MGPVHTLHEFAMNLLSDPQALAEFTSDPQAMLEGAGLGDVSAADVHEIMPLLMDTAPASATEALSSFASTGDVAGTLDNAMASTPLGELSQGVSAVLSGLPNLSGVFGAVSDLADQTGLNTTAQGVLDTGENVVDQVSDAVANVPLVGEVVQAGDIDLHHTVDAVTDHLYDGKLVGAAVDALTNHLGDALLPGAAVDAVSQLPAVGGPLSAVVEDVRVNGGVLLGQVNEAIGSTPVGDLSGPALAAGATGEEVSNVVASVNEHVGQLPLVGGVAAGVTDTVTNLVGGADFSPAGDLSGTLDHATAAVPAVPAALPAIPALPAVPAALPAIPAVPAVPAVGSLAHTVGGATAHVPGADMVPHALGAVTHTDVTEIHHEVVNTLTETHLTSTSVSDVVSHTQGLDMANLDHGVDLHATDGLLGGDLPFGH